MEKENWYFEYIYKVWKTAVRISENVPDGAAGIPDQLCSGRFGGNRLVVDQALYVAVVYRAGIKIGVLTPDHILLFIGVYILLTGVYMLYYPNFTSLTTMIRDGKLDMYLVKPVAAQFLVTMQPTGSVAFCLPDAAAGIVMIGIGWHRAGLPVTVGSIAGFLFS